MQTFVTLGGVDDAVILLLEAITHLAKTREMGGHGRAAQHLRQVVESFKRTAQVGDVGRSTLEEKTSLKQCPPTILFYLMRFEHVSGRSGGTFVESLTMSTFPNRSTWRPTPARLPAAPETHSPSSTTSPASFTTRAKRRRPGTTLPSST
ncbi:unnamed protein product [Ectocarpus sp. 6 AP-2014]